MARTGYWLMKSEPGTYSWDDFVAEGSTEWDGVRNYQARNHMRAMRVDDPVLFYHSVKQKSVVGIAKVIREAYPDHTAKKGDWDMVDIAPVRALPRPVSLDEIKQTPSLRDVALLRQSRLSVMPLRKNEFDAIVGLAER